MFRDKENQLHQWLERIIKNKNKPHWKKYDAHMVNSPTLIEEDVQNIYFGNYQIKQARTIFSNFKSFYQKGENRNGRVFVLLTEEIFVSRVPCSLLNICIVENKGDEDFRSLGVYAADSKSWAWDDLSPFLSKKCIIYGDFNVDITKGGSPTDTLLDWTDDQFLAQAIPNSPTSLRSSRVIDFELLRGLNIDIQVYGGNTASDHHSLISVAASHWKILWLKSIKILIILET